MKLNFRGMSALVIFLLIKPSISFAGKNTLLHFFENLFTRTTSSFCADSLLPAGDSEYGNSLLGAAFERVPKENRSDLVANLNDFLVTNSTVKTRLKRDGARAFCGLIDSLKSLSPPASKNRLAQMSRILALPEVMANVTNLEEVTDATLFREITQISIHLNGARGEYDLNEPIRQMVDAAGVSTLLPQLVWAAIHIHPDNQPVFHFELKRLIRLMEARTERTNELSVKSNAMVELLLKFASDRSAMTDFGTQVEALGKGISDRWEFLQFMEKWSRNSPEMRTHWCLEIQAHTAQIESPEQANQLTRLLVDHLHQYDKWATMAAHFIHRNRIVVANRPVVRADFVEGGGAGVEDHARELQRRTRLDVHSDLRDERTRNTCTSFLAALAPFRVNAGQEIANLLSYIERDFVQSQGAENRDKAQEIKNNAIRALNEPRRNRHDFTSILEPGSGFCDLKAGDVVGMLWYFAKTFNLPKGYRNPSVREKDAHLTLMTNVVVALSRGIDSDGYRICNPGKLQHLFGGVLQGYMAGIQIDRTEGPMTKLEMDAIVSGSLNAFYQKVRKDGQLPTREELELSAEEHLKLTQGMDPNGKDFEEYKRLFRVELNEFMRLSY